MKKLIMLALIFIAACFFIVYILPDKPKDQIAVNIDSQKSIDTASANDSKGSSETGDELEAYINSIFDGEQTTSENRIKILDKIQDIHWIKFDKYSKGRAFELMEWLVKQDLSESELASLMSATSGLDAAYTESYCAMVGRLCIKDKEAFIKAASKLESKKLETVCAFTAYYLGYSSNKSFTDELKIYLKTYDSSSEEKQAAQVLLKAIEAGIQ